MVKTVVSKWSVLGVFLCASSHQSVSIFLVLHSGNILIYGIYCALSFLYDRDGRHEGRVTSYIEDFATNNEKYCKERARQMRGDNDWHRCSSLCRIN